MKENRNIARGEFALEVQNFNKKIQVGARKNKIGKDWISIDKYDKSSFIDFNYDLHDLPYAEGEIDCIVCNAVLEHVEEPQLAIFEMYRVLKPGGQIWVEVPFTQPFHSDPQDYWRVTVQGMRRWMSDFNERTCGTIPNLAREAEKYFDAFHRNLGISLENVSSLRTRVTDYVAKQVDSGVDFMSIYSGVYFWGEKPSDRSMALEKARYYSWLKEHLFH